MAAFPSLTTTWHTASYPAISPSRPELSCANKTIIITGGGTGIGAGIARAFAAAGSTKIAILGRRRQILEATTKELEVTFSKLKVLACVADVSDASQVDKAFNQVFHDFGPIDVLVSNAGHVPVSAPVAEMDIDDAWATFETNTKGSMLVAQAFCRVARKPHAVVVETSSIVTILPPWPGAAAYTASKLAATKIWGFYSVENQGIRVVSIQPGQIDTDMARKIGANAKDDVDLPAHFVVWLASTEAQFLDGKFVCANWDVKELMERKKEFEESDLGTIKLAGL